MRRKSSPCAIFFTQIYDSIGVDDSNPLRKADQRKLEEKLDSLLLISSRELGGVQGLMSHLKNSPFLARWINGQLNPNAPSKPFLAAMISP